MKYVAENLVLFKFFTENPLHDGQKGVQLKIFFFLFGNIFALFFFPSRDLIGDSTVDNNYYYSEERACLLLSEPSSPKRCTSRGAGALYKDFRDPGKRC